MAQVHHITRRGLLGAGAAAMAAPAFAAARKLGPNDKVNLAVIGAGGQGAANMAKLTGENIVAACDVDFDRVARGMLDSHFEPNPMRAVLKAAYSKATRYTDYRRMFDAQKDIDAVVIATPDHHHAVAARMAMERGLHVYVQKPLTYTVEEGRRLLALSRANPGLVTQMGNQGHSGDDGRRVVELIRGGLIGKVREVHVWTNRPVWPQGVARPAPIPTPANLDWQTWLGPADVDWGYNPDYAHFNWRGWIPFGCGALGDMGAHLIDFPVWALEPGLPTRVETRHSRWPGGASLWDTKRPSPLEGFPLACVTHYEFGNAKGGPVRMTWYDGGILPPTPPGFPANLAMSPDGGVLFVGAKGMLMHETYGEKPVLIGDGLEEKAKKIGQTLPRIKGGLAGHETNFVRAIRGEEPASCPFDYAVPLNETMILGIVALKADRPIEYDGAAGRVTNAPDANQYLTRTYRKGWEL
ncbi:Gfo/Idh/MocA family oxidoreductase [Phenylobacterium sp.]|uniref:Gfo/Idh/MocA family protein n=1 Tax=Phenylobacterium sp. TaxID=1871053 RepID=UPI0025F2ACED|nr:Gfo/Idh/MocA family oxidoreductase [Phenylobacterium sp.]MBX3484171.1 Gfo/Idh/MocA family oxidoreductase [Phenylobacterium sp.]MCW5760005.1 Gfo/Idh/MocA family oxidoreductase [Phenylobacterium sp.]